MQKKQRLIAAWALCAAWMAVIFALSAAPGEVSGEQSGAIVRALLALFPAAAPAADALSLLVRKAAHMAEYAVLFWLYRRALWASGARRPGAAAFLMAAAYAATDECHQMFVPGRGPAAADVLIDSAGAACAWAACALHAAWKKRRQ